MAIHGALRDFTIKGRPFKVVTDGPGSKNIGGRNNEVQMNGDGSYRIIQSVVPGAFADIQIEIDDSRNDQEFLQGIADDGLAISCVATYASNISFAGKLTITGEITADESTGIASLSFMGGILTQI